MPCRCLVTPGLTREMGRDKALMARVLPGIKADHLAMDRYELDEAGKARAIAYRTPSMPERPLRALAATD